MANRLLLDEDELRSELLAETGNPASPEFRQTSMALGELPPRLPEDQDPPVEVPGVEVPQPDSPSDAAAEPKPQPTGEGSGRGLSRRGFDKVMQALYAAGTSTKIAPSMWAQDREHDPLKADPLLDLKRQQMMANLALTRKKAGEAGGLTDEDRAMQDAMLQNPQLAQQFGGEEVIRRLGGKSLVELFKQGDRVADNTLNSSKFDESKRMNEEKIRQNSLHNRMSMRQQDEVNRRFAGTALQNYGKAVAPDVPVVSTLQAIEQRTLKENPDGTVTSLVRGWAPKDADKAGVPDLGVWQKMKLGLAQGLGTQFTDADVVALKSETAMLSEYFARGLAGATFTPDEMARMTKILNDAMLSSPQAMASSLDMVRRLTAHKIRGREASFAGSIDDNGWQQYAANGGITTKMPLFDDIDFGRGQGVGVAGAQQSPRVDLNQPPPVPPAGSQPVSQAQPPPVDEELPPGVTKVSPEELAQLDETSAKALMGKEGVEVGVQQPQRRQRPQAQPQRQQQPKLTVSLGPDEVEVISPDGARFAISKDEVADALANGWRRVTGQ